MIQKLEDVKCEEEEEWKGYRDWTRVCVVEVVGKVEGKKR